MQISAAKTMVKILSGSELVKAKVVESSTVTLLGHKANFTLTRPIHKMKYPVIMIEKF